MVGVTGSIPVAPTTYPLEDTQISSLYGGLVPALKCQNRARTVPICPQTLGNARAKRSAGVPPDLPITKKNAVAGVKARNGADLSGSGKGTKHRNKANRANLASALTAVLDGQGMVVCVLAGRVEARAFLRGGRT